MVSRGVQRGRSGHLTIGLNRHPGSGLAPQFLSSTRPLGRRSGDEHSSSAVPPEQGSGRSPCLCFASRLMVDGGSTFARDYRPSIWSGPVSLADISITYASPCATMRHPTHRGMANNRCGERITEQPQVDKIRRYAVMCASSDSDMRYTVRNACDHSKALGGDNAAAVERPSAALGRAHRSPARPPTAHKAWPGPLGHSPQDVFAVSINNNVHLLDRARRVSQAACRPASTALWRTTARRSVSWKRSPQRVHRARFGRLPSSGVVASRAIGIRVPVMHAQHRHARRTCVGAHVEPLQAREHLVLRLLVQGPPAERLDVTGDQVRRRAV